MRSVSLRLLCLQSLLALSLVCTSLPSAQAQQVGPSPTATPEVEHAGGMGTNDMLPPPAAPTAPVAEPAQPTVLSPPTPEIKPEDPAKWSPQIYGFVEFDMIGDSTQSFNDLAGNAAIARPNSYGADHGRVTFGARNSRIGFKLGAPQMGVVKASAVLEMDFLGNQPTGTSESAVFASPIFRVRHMALKLETPFADLLLGQSWQLFGWQPYFHPNTVEIQGLPGQVYSRSPQARLSHRFKSDGVDFEIAVAAARPPQRDSQTPDGQAGMRLLFNHWKGVHTTGGTGTAADAAAIGVSGVARRFAVPELTAAPKFSHSKAGWGISADAMLPLIPATADNRSNGLTLTGSFVRGEGIADLFTGLNGGVTTYPALPANAMGMVPTYTPNIDAGDVMYDSAGKLHTIGWQGILAGLQYYFPGSGKVWLSSNYSNFKSHNAADLANGKATSVFKKSQWVDANLFWDAVPAVRFGLEGAWFEQTYADNMKTHDYRLQFSSFYIF